MLRTLLICCLALLPCAHAADVWLRIGTLDVVPYGYISVKNRPDGAFYQLGNRIAALAGLQTTNTLLPTARLYAMLERKQLDLAITSLSLDTRAGMVNLGRVWRFDGVVLYRRDLHPAPKALADFRPHLIGRLNNTCPLLASQGLKVYELTALSQGLRMLEAKRLDGICGEAGSLNAAMRASKLDMTRYAEPFVFLSADVSVYANPQLPDDVLNRLRVAISQLNDNGDTSQLIGKYIDIAPVAPTFAAESPMTVTALQDALHTWRSHYPRFDAAGLSCWLVEGTLAGWICPAMATRLLESGLFEPSEEGLRLSAALGGPLGRTHALQCLAEVLRGEGWIHGWRDEAYDWVDDWGRVRFSLERAAFRPLGLCSRAIHVNGYIEDGGIWVARRAGHKAVDPDRLDNLTAGGVAAGESVRDCLLRELAEEAGIPTRLALLARPAGVLRSQRREADGVHDEMLYCFDLALPPDFVPINTDGEVAGFELISADEAAARLDEMTLDAGLVTAAWLDRWMDGEV